MKFFQHAPAQRALGPLLREARAVRELSLEAAAAGSRLPLGDIEALENDQPLDPGRARFQAVCYARFLGLDPLMLHDALPPLPGLIVKNRQFIINTVRPLKLQRTFSPFEMLAPMGKAALYLVVIAALLGTWGMVRQLSRIRSIPWISSNYSVRELLR